jgi:hypothetical protein
MPEPGYCLIKIDGINKDERLLFVDVNIFDYLRSLPHVESGRIYYKVDHNTRYKEDHVIFNVVNGNIDLKLISNVAGVNQEPGGEGFDKDKQPVQRAVHMFVLVELLNSLDTLKDENISRTIKTFKQKEQVSINDIYDVYKEILKPAQVLTFFKTPAATLAQKAVREVLTVGILPVISSLNEVQTVVESIQNKIPKKPIMPAPAGKAAPAA